MSLPHPEENPWITQSEKVVYDNPWIRLTEFQIIDPGGQAGIYGLVHYKNLAIGIIPVDEAGYTYLVGQYRYPLKQYSWEIIEGGGPLADTPLASAQRELKEETGFTAAHYTEIVRMHLSNSVSNELAIIYLATGLTAGQAMPDSTEDLHVKRVPLDVAIRHVEEGVITDSLSVAGLQRLEILRLRGELDDLLN